MLRQFFPELSQSFINLLRHDNKYCDVTIKVGNVKDFRAHKNILCYRSQYFQGLLDPSKKNVELPNVSPEIFQIILEYIYGGTILYDHDQDTSDTIKVLLAADELGLRELVKDLQKYLIENKSEWMEQHFQLTRQTSLKSNSFPELRKFCTDFMAKSPEKILKSSDFTSLSKESLIQLIKRDDLQMKEIEIWEHVLKWGLAKHPAINPIPRWEDNDLKDMEKTLQDCLPHIRFYCLSYKDFLQKIGPHSKLIKSFNDILNSHTDPNSKPTDNIKLPRNIKIDKIIDSKIVNLSDISTISEQIDKKIVNDFINHNFTHVRELYLPYKFELLLRGSRDGFTPKKFHELCNGKHNTVTFMKVKGTEEIIGGYNPLEWKSPSGYNTEYGKTKDSFIFSFKNENNFIKDVIISNVENTNNAICNYHAHGPCFGNDDIYVYSSNESTNYETVYCKKRCYEKKIRDSSDKFSIEDYEVFQIIKR